MRFPVERAGDEHSETLEERATNHRPYANELRALDDKQLSFEVYRLNNLANREDHEISDEDLRRLRATEYEADLRAALEREIAIKDRGIQRQATATPETRLERYQREARESGNNLSDRVPDQDRNRDQHSRDLDRR